MLKLQDKRHAWAIGDVQGCLTGLRALLQKIDFDPQRDVAVFAGDIINRGPESLDTLRFIRSLGASAHCVLGNHDLHFLAVAAGVREAGKSDTLQDLLSAPDRDELVEWLRQQALALKAPGFVITHAGVPPNWTLEDLSKESQSLKTILRSTKWKLALASLFGNEPSLPELIHDETSRHRYAVNALTRLRFIRPDGGLDMVTKETAAPEGSGLVPWFKVPNRRWLETPKAPRIVFGHWAALGVFENEHVVSIDGGYVWGRELVAYRLHPNTDGERFVRVSAPQSISA